MSHSITRRRRWRTFATTLALTLGSLTVPAAALADGQLDPAFNGTGLHVGSVAEGTVFANTDNRIPMVVQSDGRDRHRRRAQWLHDARALQRRRLARHDVRRRRIRDAAVRRHAHQVARQQRRHRDDARRRRQHHRRRLRRLAVDGRRPLLAVGIYISSAVCYAPHLIDYSARALTLRNGANPSARRLCTRPPSRRCRARCSVRHVRPARNGDAPGQRQQRCPLRHLRSDARRILARLHRREDRRAARTGAVHDATRGGRWYDGVATVGAADNRYVVASTTARDGAAWVQRFTAGGGFDAATFNPGGAGSGVAGRVDRGRKPARSPPARNGRPRRGRVARRGRHQPPHAGRPRQHGRRAWSAASGRRRRRSRSRRGRQQHRPGLRLPGREPDRRRLREPRGQGGSRSRAHQRHDRVADPTFGVGGQTATPVGTPAVNAYITGMALSTSRATQCSTSPDARARRPAWRRSLGATTRRRPAAAAAAPAAATNSVDLITTSSARVGGTVNANGTASTWWIEYGTTTGYGAATAAQPIAAPSTTST